LARPLRIQFPGAFYPLGEMNEKRSSGMIGIEKNSFSISNPPTKGMAQSFTSTALWRIIIIFSWKPRAAIYPESFII
jgi:hypothetical protein